MNLKHSFYNICVKGSEYMKKICLLFVLIFMITNQHVKAETIITVPGLGTDELLKKEKESVIASNVNWNKEGEYQVEYYDEMKKTFGYKKIMIVNEKTLTEGMDFISSDDIMYHNQNYQMNKILFFTQDEYYIVGSMYDGLKDIPFIQHYQFGILVGLYQFQDCKEGTFRDIVVANGKVYVVGDYIKNTSFTRDVILLELSSSFQVLQMRRIGGERHGYAKKLYTLKNRIAVITESKSRYHDYNSETEYNKVTVHFFDYNFSNHQFENFNNSFDSIYYDSFIQGSDLYLFIHVEGWGYFINTREDYQFDVLIKINTQFYDYDRIDFTYLGLDDRPLLEYKKIIPRGDGIELITYQENQIEFYLFSSHLILQKKNTYQVEKEYIIVSLLATGDENMNLIILKRNKYTEERCLSIDTLDENYRSVHSFSKKTQYMLFVNGEEMNGKLMFGGLETDRSQKVIPNVSHYQAGRVVESTTENTYFEITSNALYINEKEVLSELLNYRTPTTYGRTIFLSKYQKNDLLFYLPYTVYMLPKANVEEGEVYDIGLRLEFNGTAYLNNQLVTKNHTINEVGFYSLKLVSKENEEKVIHFTIENLCSNMKPIEGSKKEIKGIKVAKNEQIFQMPEINYQSIHLIVESNSTLSMIILISLISCLSVMMIPYRLIGGKKHV